MNPEINRRIVIGSPDLRPLAWFLAFVGIALLKVGLHGSLQQDWIVHSSIYCDFLSGPDSVKDMDCAPISVSGLREKSKTRQSDRKYRRYKAFAHKVWTIDTDCRLSVARDFSTT